MLLRLTAALVLFAATSAASGAQGALVTMDRYCLQAAPSVTTAACDPGDNQFRLHYNASRNAFTVRTAAGHCLDGYRGKGRPLAVVPCDGTTEQDWWVHASGALQNQRRFGGYTYCADVSGGLGGGRNVVLWDCHSGANQQFAFGQVSSSRVASGTASAPVSTATARIGNGAARLIAAGGGNLIGAGGGNLIGPGSLNLIAAGGGN